MDSNQKIALTATSSGLQPLIETLVSLQGWAANSMQYVKRRNHLSADEKEGIFQRFEQYEYHFHKLIKKYSEGVTEIEPEAIQEEIEKHLQMQAKFNRYARHHEFPPYPLPDTIPTEKAFEVYFEVLDDTYNNILYKGDHLKCKPVSSLAELEQGDLVVVTYRYDYRSPRKVKIGLFSGLMGNDLLLKYDDPRLIKNHQRWAVSMHEVVHIFNVQTISRDRRNRE